MVAINLDVFDVLPGAASAVVTPVAGSAVTTIVQWEQEVSIPTEQMVGAGAGSALNRRVICFVRRDEVPTLPVGSTIVGGPAHNIKTWRVVSVGDDPEFHVATVV